MRYVNGYRGAKAAVALTPFGGAPAVKSERPNVLPSRLAFGVVLALGLSDLAILNLHLAPRLAAADSGASGAAVAESERPASPARTAQAAAAITPADDVKKAPAVVTAPAGVTAPAAPAPAPAVIEKRPRERAIPDIEFDLGRVDTRNMISINGLKATLAELVADPSRRLLIRGHSDRLGSRELNLSLSRRRAEMTRRWLVARGAPADRIDIEAVGTDEPASTGDGPAAWAKNRRVELLWQ